MENDYFCSVNSVLMRKNVFILAVAATMMFSSCAVEFNRVYKSVDYDYKYEFAKECFARGKFSQAITLLQELVTIQKGTENAEECLYMLAMAQFCDRDYETASMTFKKYFKTYPKGRYAEQACYYVGQSLFMSMPDPRLDQTPTMGAINAFQEFMDYYPESHLRGRAQQKMIELEDNLVSKEYMSARLYYYLGGYFGNCTNGGSNYEACIVTAENALKQYPYSDLREDFCVLIMKSKYELAVQSVDEKRVQRYRDAEDECYAFISEFPESEEIDTAEKFIEKCKKITND